VISTAGASIVPNSCRLRVCDGPKVLSLPTCGPTRPTQKCEWLVDTALHHEFAGLIQFLPTVERILYGAHSIEGYLESEVERFSGQRVFLLAPRSLKSPAPFQRVAGILGKRLAESFIAAFEHVPLDVVVEAAAAARDCNADLVVALGGGSVIDAAKAVRTCLAAGLTTSQLLGSFMECRGALAATLIPQISIRPLSPVQSIPGASVRLTSRLASNAHTLRRQWPAASFCTTRALRCPRR
jgi:hypothetical protein